VGCAATLIHFVVLSVLVEACHFPWPTVASAIGSGFGITTAYLGNYHWTFCRTEPHRQFLSRFVGSYIVTMAFHTVLMYVQIDGLGMSWVIAFVIATSISTIMNFTLNKFVVFERWGPFAANPFSTRKGGNAVS
jgi:putative flippase GtrA